MHQEQDHPDAMQGFPGRRIFNDRGNRMSPDYARKGNILNTDTICPLSSSRDCPKCAGAVSRIPAAEIEGLITRAVRDQDLGQRTIGVLSPLGSSAWWFNLTKSSSR